VRRNKTDPTHPFIYLAIVFMWISALPISASSSLQERGIITGMMIESHINEGREDVPPAGPSVSLTLALIGRAQSKCSTSWIKAFCSFSDESLFDFVGCLEKARDPHGCWDGMTCCFQTGASCRGCCGRYITPILRLQGQSKSTAFLMYFAIFFSTCGFLRTD